jgi:hypothetical protein
MGVAVGKVALAQPGFRTEKKAKRYRARVEWSNEQCGDRVVNDNKTKQGNGKGAAD